MLSTPAAQVMGPTTPGPAALIVDCPSADFLPVLTGHPGFAPWLDGGKLAAVVVHLAPSEVCGPGASSLT